MLDRERLLAAYDRQVRTAEHSRLPPGVRAEADGPIVRVVGWDHGFISPPADLGLEGADLDALIRRQRDFFALRGQEVEWKLRGHDLPPQLPKRPQAAGFRPQPQEAVLIGLAVEMTAPGVELPARVRIREVALESDLRRIEALHSAVWGDDRSWLANDLIARKGASPQDLRILVAEAGEQVVSAAWVELNPGTEFAGLWGGSTLPGWRRLGIYRALVAARAQMAVGAGYRYLQVDASPDSRPILERLGMVQVTTTTPYVWAPEGPGPALQAPAAG